MEVFLKLVYASSPLKPSGARAAAETNNCSGSGRGLNSAPSNLLQLPLQLQGRIKMQWGQDMQSSHSAQSTERLLAVGRRVFWIGIPGGRRKRGVTRAPKQPGFIQSAHLSSHSRIITCGCSPKEAGE